MLKFVRLYFARIVMLKQKVINNMILIYQTIDILISVYAVVALLIKLFVQAGYFEFHTYFMKETFFGLSMLVMLIWKNEGLVCYKRDIMNKLSFGTNGVLALCIVTTNDYKLYLLALIVLCFMLARGYGSKYSIDAILKAAFITLFLLEGYVLWILANHNILYEESLFSKNFLLDVLLVMIFILINNRKCKDVLASRRVEEGIRRGCYFLSVVMTSVLLYLVIISNFCDIRVNTSEEDIYILRSANNPEWVLTIDEEAEAVYFAEYTGVNTQKIVIEPSDTDGEMVHIRFVESGKMLDIDEGSAEAGTIVVPWGQDGTATQNWRIVSEGKKCLIQSIHDNYLSTQFVEVEEERSASLWQKNSELVQSFILEHTVREEHITKTAYQFGDYFTPTLLLSTMVTRFKEYTIVLFMIITFFLAKHLNIENINKNKVDVVYCLVFIYGLWYGAVSLLGLIVVLMFLRKRGKLSYEGAL